MYWMTITRERKDRDEGKAGSKERSESVRRFKLYMRQEVVE